jgi:mannonate dehydratase
MGKDVFEAARAFAKIDKLWKVHYTDMKKLMQTLVDVDFRDILIADHVPRMVGDNRTGWAYSIGDIRAL